MKKEIDLKQFYYHNRIHIGLPYQNLDYYQG